MKEQIVNIFVYGDATHVHAIGWRVYDKAGTYDELTAFLRSRVQRDHRIAARNDLDEPIPWRDFKAVDRVNPTAGSLIGAGIVNEYAVYCLTHIVNGEVRVDGTVETAGGGSVAGHCQRKTGLSWEEASCNCLRMKNPFRYFKTSPEIIRLAVMMQGRFPLSLRNLRIFSTSAGSR